jgi:hypothetical protein
VITRTFCLTPFASTVDLVFNYDSVVTSGGVCVVGDGYVLNWLGS